MDTMDTGSDNGAPAGARQRLANLYQLGTANSRIHIHPQFLKQGLDRAIETQIRQKVEGICNRNGFVKKKSVKLLKRSVGMASSNESNGYVSFDVFYQVAICHPVANELYVCEIKTCNKLGFHVVPHYESQDKVLLPEDNPLVIIIPKQHVKIQELDTLKVGDNVVVRVIGSRFDLGDDKISVVGTITEKITTDIGAFLRTKIS
jgi:DNA-directed RNA polymerase subunit E'/Rpb7